MRIQIRNTVANKALLHKTKDNLPVLQIRPFLLLRRLEIYHIWFCQGCGHTALPGPPTLLSYAAGAQRHHTAFSWALNIADNAKNYQDWIFFFFVISNRHTCARNTILMSLSKWRMYDVLMELAVCAMTYEDVRTTVWCTDVCAKYERMHEAWTKVLRTGVHIHELCAHRTYRLTELTYGRKDVRYGYVLWFLCHFKLFWTDNKGL